MSIFKDLESIKRLSSQDKEFWMSREYMGVLGYSEWRDFNFVIDRAIKSCENNGRHAANHFVQMHKMIEIGKGGRRKVNDYALSRYACYLIAMSGSSAKPEVAAAQEYFAIQTRKSELTTQSLVDRASERISQREQLTENQKKLNAAAQSAGVTRFGKFQNKGYEAMYGGLNNEEVKEHKGINQDDALFDRIGRAELAAHNFRATQAETRIIAEQIDGEDKAIRVHQETGNLVREAMKQAGGKYPEELPIEEHIEDARVIVGRYKAFKSVEQLRD